MHTILLLAPSFFCSGSLPGIPKGGNLSESLPPVLVELFAPTIRSQSST